MVMLLLEELDFIVYLHKGEGKDSRRRAIARDAFSIFNVKITRHIKDS
jgi:hypothetical protein